ncbi:RNA polymerase sigma factor [Winogradskyella tangerina]|uniref:RNA polymerase sigma factor n=1 Tax=Winogradskyella tangerina TaxID=2023240 RepID=UPI000DBE5CA2|nr:sigma-70 family RNA polymerase sigma factor [Winogradskyella tangerina]
MKDDRDTDEALILKFKAGNKEALAILVKRWHRPFCNKAYWITRDKSAAKDIAQDSWSTIIQKIESLDEPKKFKYWAYRIVCNKSTDWLRLQSKNVRFSEGYNLQANPTKKDHSADEHLKKLLLDAINNLPQNQKMVVRLFYLKSYSLKQISDLLNISIGTTKSRLFHAREKLKTTLKHKNYEN